MDAPLVSAIMPVFNGERFLEDALRSLLAQEYRPFEIVVCDDGSTDDTPKILRGFPEVRVIRQENKGAAAARNAAIAVSSGELLAFFDADDLWPSNRLSLQAEYLAEHPETGCVLGRQEWINPPPTLTRDLVYGDLGGIPHLSAMIRRAAFEEAGAFDPSYRVAEDTDLLFRLRERQIDIAVLKEVILIRRFHGKNLTAGPDAPSELARALKERVERARAAQRRQAEPGGAPDPT
jgi:glycosyltransferase involved in cell wall biosynthesis